jgi:hypothetical protein
MLSFGSDLQVFRSLRAYVVASYRVSFVLGILRFVLVCLGSASLGAWPTSSFYRPRRVSGVSGPFEKEPLFCGKTECLYRGIAACPYAPCRLCSCSLWRLARAVWALAPSLLPLCHADPWPPQLGSRHGSSRCGSCGRFMLSGLGSIRLEGSTSRGAHRSCVHRWPEGCTSHECAVNRGGAQVMSGERIGSFLRAGVRRS